MSCGVMPALAMAMLAAATPMVVVVSPVLAAKRLSLMPVRSCIQSSLVSIYRVRALLVTGFSGVYHANTGNFTERHTASFKEQIKEKKPARTIRVLQRLTSGGR